jgi:hypothetical protein
MNPPEELFGQEPSLVQLIDFVKYNNEHFNDLSLDVLDYYYNAANDIGNVKNKYYLGGQIAVSITDPITEKLIEKVRIADKKSQQEYGEPCNSFELASIANANRLFENIQDIITRYYEIKIHELYRPPQNGDNGGKMYQKIAEQTLIGK